MKKMNKKGFTLTELVIVIVIIAILAAVLIPSMTGYVKRAKKANAQQEAASVYTIYAAWLADDQTANSYYQATNQDTLTAGDTTEASSSRKDGTIDKVTYFWDNNTAYSKVDSHNLAWNFARYYADAQDITLTAAQPSATPLSGDNQYKYYEAGNIKFVLAAKDAFYMISSNGFGVYVTISNGVPSYDVTDSAVVTLATETEYFAKASTGAVAKHPNSTAA